MTNPDIIDNGPLPSAPRFTETPACTGLWDTFDPPEPGESRESTRSRFKAAQEICSYCPVLRQCKDWLESLDKNDRPQGVVAGEIRYSFAGRKPTLASSCPQKARTDPTGMDDTREGHRGHQKASSGLGQFSCRTTASPREVNLDQPLQAISA